MLGQRPLDPSNGPVGREQVTAVLVALLPGSGQCELDQRQLAGLVAGVVRHGVGEVVTLTLFNPGKSQGLDHGVAQARAPMR